MTLPSLPTIFIDTLQTHFGKDFCLISPEDCWVYGFDDSKQFIMPNMVVLPASHEDVVFVTRLCNEYHIPLIPRGLGSGTVGGCVPIQGGVVLSLARMNRILHIDIANRLAVVEPGVTNLMLQKALQPHHLCWAPDPGSQAFCTIGGNLAHNSAGPRAIKYGTPRENTLALQAVTGAGETLISGVMTTKGVVGYDLTRLLIGSEGTLATITQATLKLLPKANSHATIRAAYRDTQSAVDAIIQCMSHPDMPAALEFLDATALQLIQKNAQLEFPTTAKAVLLIGVEGNHEQLPVALKRMAALAENAGLCELKTALTPADNDILWHARRCLSPALKHVAPQKINEDVVVPVTQLPSLLATIEALSETYQMTIVTFGHAGNGNLHVNLMFDATQPGQTEKAAQCLSDLFDAVLKLDGSISGEHGVGLAKQPFITRELGAENLKIMREIKHIFDPRGILNPGKIW